ncbi:proline iminopeptidase-family hydrolase [Novosphingobium olei]|uniref:Proline iminopeptidase-family hydrolase n=1 Tax=Novosphingobium olei TaxID=2728851 RepID=A0A7Y0BNN9_9SPHN|nr:proline iminopeptidase-family hydrolase [Novosphingobium olei]NML93752.1 proline iminopeptidase-family hydrolase [Novosphingobium olei]
MTLHRIARWLAPLSLVLSTVPGEAAPPDSYYATAGRPDAWSGGATMIPIHTPKGDFRVWVKRVGNNPKLKVLLLHGGPAVPHDYLEAMDSFLPGSGIEYIYYDQLGAGLSDKPDDDDLWTLERYVDEVDQVRTALGLGPGNFCLYGQSWGGILAMEYALKHQDALKCLVISNMMASIPAYNAYADKVLKPQMKPDDLAMVEQLEAQGKTSDPRYMGILIPGFYEKHILRRPAAQWPEPVNRAFARQNVHVYTLMQGPSELGSSGRLEKWDRFADLHTIKVPTLVIGARHDTMDPAYMERMAKEFPKGSYALMANGSHLALYDDQQAYFAALIAFLKRQE